MAYKFNLPEYNDLNVQQKEAVSAENCAIAVNGGPGTGKTVVAVWRHILNHQLKRSRSVLLTYTKTLRYFLEGSVKAYVEKMVDVDAKRGAQNAGHHVKPANSWHGSEYDEIIVDEAQDIPEYCIINL